MRIQILCVCTIVQQNMAPHAVPSLEELAFEASFKDILATLALCYDHRPEGKRYDCLLVPSAFSNSFLTSEKLRKFVRNRLDQHLVGLVGVKVRYKRLLKEIFFFF